MSQNRNSGGNKRNRSHHHYQNKNKINVGDRGKEILENIDENSEVIKQFRGYGIELDTKHDRYERIVKINRDITIESKRIIFLLHTIDKESKRETVLSEAKKRLDNLMTTLFRNIAIELDEQDPWQYVRAYRGGLQEFIEALTFYYYLVDNSLFHWDKLEENFIYKLNEKKEENLQDITDIKIIKTLLPPHDYVLGIADLTGELMRKCINNLATGDITSCYQTCNIVRDMHRGFLSCAGIAGKEINKKLYTLKQSLTKMENVCYTIKVRGSEIPKHMLADVAITASDDYPTEDDEGYQGF